ncbi:MAG TPA: histidine phosphatase family protein [Anaerolineae bacterium]|nr:histidine phosphatase family protein [Anaerolineae bacterium]
MLAIRGLHRHDGSCIATIGVASRRTFPYTCGGANIVMQFYFIRHAQSVNNALYDQTGSWNSRNEDPELTDTGRQQAQHLAQFIVQADVNFDPSQRNDANRFGFSFTHIYTSLMLRAVSTGTPLADALGLPLVAWVDAHETGGIFLDDEVTGKPIGLPGKTRADFEAHFPNLVLPAELDHTGWWNRPFETDEERLVRARRFLTELLARHGSTDDRVAVISHGGFYNRFIRALLNWTPPAGEWPTGTWFDVNNASISRFDVRGDGLRIVYLNRTDHLPSGLIT